ncbi:MAG: TIGR04283 family arsenosugar biosynthesis glycosyltransferase [Synechococcaceae cyanobacterium]|nr:TIGR04283 family arsenosugar biosynthesis glycosyltransferase [Synechococcaceae cyanobacterium]
MTPPPLPLSVVIAARDEAARLPLLLADLAAASPPPLELVVVDGRSRDATARLARLAGARVLSCPPCRGAQQALGVAATAAPWLLLLHADARLPQGWERTVQQAMDRGTHGAWAFRLAIAGDGPGLRLVELAVLLRCRWRRLPYGDQGLLLPRTLLQAAGGLRPLPLMEDLDLVLRLRRLGPLQLLPAALRVDGRRWRRLGIWRVSLSNARLRRAWRAGVPAEELAARYYGGQAAGGSAQEAYQKAQRRCSGSSSQPWAE